MKHCCGKGPHYVYYLYDANGLLADIGRSINPRGRKLVKERLAGETFTMKTSRPIALIEDACNRERRELRKYRPRLSRIAMSAKGTFGKPRSEAARLASSKKLKGIPLAPDHAAKLAGSGNGMYGKHHTKAAKKAMSKARKGVLFTPKHLANLVAANRSEKRRKEISDQKKGVPLTAKNLRGIRRALRKPEVRARMSVSHLGKKTDPAVVAKIAKSNTGKKRTPEQIARMRQAQRKRYAKEHNAKR